MAGALAKYSFINAKLRARISKILPDEVFHQLAQSPSVDAALVLLRDTPFAHLEEIYGSTGDLRLAELELLKGEIELYRSIHQHLHESSGRLVDVLLSQFEIDNLKNAIRIYFERKVRGRVDESAAHYILYERILHAIPMDVIVNAQNLDEIAGVCQGTPYRAIIEKYGPVVESEGSLFRMEVAFDQLYYAHLVSAINGLDRADRDVAIRLIGVEIDLENISWIIRFKKFYDLPFEAVLAALIPGGFHLNRATIDELYQAQNITSVLQKFVVGTYPGLSALLASQASDSTTRLTLIRRILEEIRRHEVRRILAGYPFTIGILLAYFILKADEMKKIRMILNAKQLGRSLERIESML
jgi:V/A-type H+-transporting ATPase subunit C